MKKIVIASLCLLIGALSYGQESENESEENFRHMISAGIGHAVVLQGVRDGESDWLYVPSFAIQYNYLISKKVSLGLHIDALIERFEIENSKGVEIERERPVATILAGGYKLSERFSLLLGTGVEWEKNENYGLVRFGVDYAHPLGDKGFEFIAAFNSDILFGGYNTLNIGLGVGKKF